MKQFTAMLAIKGTDEEIDYYKRSIISAINLEPDELLITVDYPFPIEWKKRVIDIFHQNNFDKFRIIEIKKSAEWGFQLAKVVWECYAQAKYDYIYHFDIDSIVRRTILTGLEDIGENDMALISFTKRLRIKNLQELIRYWFYRLRVRTSDYTFSGNYWVYRPIFYEIVAKEEYQKIRNGIDTFLTEAILFHPRYKMITRKEIGIQALSLQNEDYDWRQFQDGMWIYANRKRFREINEEYNRKIRGKLKRRRGILSRHPLLLVIIKSIVYQRWGILEGYFWAKKHQDADEVRLAGSMSNEEWGCLGSEHVRWIKQFKDVGTGF